MPAANVGFIRPRGRFSFEMSGAAAQQYGKSGIASARALDSCLVRPPVLFPHTLSRLTFLVRRFLPLHEREKGLDGL